MSVKAKRVIRVELEVIVDTVEFSTMDEAEALQRGVTADAFRDAVRTYLSHAFPTITMPKAKVEVGSVEPIQLIAINDENEEAYNQLFDKTVNDEHQKWMANRDIVDQIGRELGIKHTVWSADDEALINNDKVFEHGDVVFEYSDGWGDEAPIRTRPFHNPTYRDVWNAADEVIGKSNDKHHVFIETVKYDRTVDGVLIYKLIFGS